MLFSAQSMLGQKQKAKKATEEYNEYAYQEAIDKYEDLVASGYSTDDIYKNLGNSHFANAEYEEAAKWYGELMGLEEEIEPEYIYRYALSLKSIGKYAESDTWMNKYLESNNEDIRAQRYAEKVDYLKKIKEQSVNIELINLDINTKESDFAPSVIGQQLIYSTARDTGVARNKIHEWNNKAFLDLYQANILVDGHTDESSLSKLDRKINSKTHESSAIFTRDEQTLYFTRNNSKNGDFARDDEGISRLKVFTATKKKNRWKDVKELPFNSNEYSVAHPALSLDEKRLYFASDMPGTYGSSDIFYVDINEDGSFGEPVNLGPEINTESRETFPHLDKNNILYFASDGHPGLGGLDIFAAQIQEEGITEPVNLGQPINSPQDDFSLVKDTRNNNGYFASNRPGGKGSDDIYGFVIDDQEQKDILEMIVPPNTSVITGIVVDQATGLPLENARIKILDKEEKVLGDKMTNTDGSFSIEPEIVDIYKIQIEVPSCNEESHTQILMDGEDGPEVVSLRKTRQAPLGADLLAHLDINPIFFDLARSQIRKDAWVDLGKVITYLNAYPEAKIRIRSHTDSRASETYNKDLSERRAYATLAYLVERGGIDQSRLTAQGFGESQLKNDCADGVRCSENEHQANRRSEFIIVE
jgi:outer membrane protein OmpA-like peptidoglycan-associated protein